MASAARAGTVVGKLDLPSAAPPRAASSHVGYLERSENPYLPVRGADTTPQMFVVLVGGPPAPAGAIPQARWLLQGDAFDKPLLPVAAGTEVVIKNVTKDESITLAIPSDPDRLPKGPINATGSKSFKVGAAGTTLDVVDPERPYVHGRIVVAESPYFASPDATGKFEIANVPDGKWTLRVWYRDGYIDRADDNITVGPAKNNVTAKIPAGYPVKAGAPAAKAAAK